MAKTYDFCGYVTKNNVRCNDGVVIRRDAFKDQDGTTVPLVWQHNHNDPEAVIGHAVLENRKDGVYGYIKLNDTDAGKAAKAIVDNGDVNSMSIWANNLKRSGATRKDIVHGVIREVSLVLSGANPGALIEATNVVHGDGEDWDEAVIYTDGMVLADDEPEELAHSAETETKVEAVEETKAEEPKAEEPDEIEHSAETDKKDNTKTESEEQTTMADEKKTEANDKTIGDIIETMNEEQKQAMYALVGEALQSGNADDADEEEDTVKHNAWEDTKDKTGYEFDGDVISHDAMTKVIADAKRIGSMKEAAIQNGLEDISYIQHDSYGVTNVDYLFPDYKNLTSTPTFISRDMDWVSSLMGGIRHTPFTRIKSIHADITGDDARALGYIKGKLKKDEVFTLLKRTTDPQTIYKKQRMDRDDIVDITDFDVVAWLKAEMQTMLKEEIARDVLIGDGRATSSDDHVSADHVRPIWTDADLYTIKYAVELAADATDDAKAKALIKAAVKARNDYKGSGNPIMFTTPETLTDMLLLEDSVGRPLYTDVNALASKMLVSKIVTVELMADQTRVDDDSKTRTLAAIIVNPRDYTIGTDKGGQLSLFDDFDIDYNRQKYLIETRISGAMTVPYGAIALETIAATS